MSSSSSSSRRPRRCCFAVWTVVTVVAACGFGGGGDILRFSDGFRPAVVVQLHRSSVARMTHLGRAMRLLSSPSNRRSISENEEDVNAENADEGVIQSKADAVPSCPATATTTASSIASSSSFNPFAYDASNLGRGGSSSSTSTTTKKNNVVSLRNLQMQDLNDQLLAAASIAERYTILVEHRDLLLAPIVDGDDTAVGADSIYRHCQTIPERYSAFATSLTARIELAQSPIVRTILQEMKDYVLAQQQSPPEERDEQQERQKNHPKQHDDLL